VAKKRRTAKQKAASKRNIKKAQTKRRKSSKPRKANKPRKTSKNVAKKRKAPSRGGGGGIINKIPFLKNKVVQRVGFGLGMGSIAAIIASKVPVPQVQQNAQLIGTGISFATDPLSGVVRLALSGGLGQLGNLFGSGNSGGNSSNGGGMNGGFA